MGGGVVIQTHKSISFKELPTLTLNEENIESVFIEITKIPSSNFKPIVGVIYRPPNSNIEQFLVKLANIFNDLNRGHKPCYIMGDFNFDLLSQDNANTQAFTDLIYSYSFFPLIDKPTRIKPPSATLIDNIFTNIPQQSHVSGILYTDISDHLPIFAINESISLNRKCIHSSRSFQCRTFSDSNLATFRGRLRETEWDEIFTTQCCDEAYSRFISILTNLYNDSFPINTRTFTNKKNQPWINRELKRLINKKNRLYKEFMRRPTVFNEINYRVIKKHASKQIRQAKKNYYHNLLETNKNNLRKTWKIIKEVMGAECPTSVVGSVSVDGSLVSEQTAVADHLNEFFSNIGTKLASQIPASNISPLRYMTTNYPHSFFLTPVTPEELKHCAEKIKDGSAGFDDLKPNIIKKTFDYLLDPLLYIINLSFSSGIVPNLLKRANVTPIYKGGDSTGLDNLRPISVLPVFAKIIEKLMFKLCLKTL